MCVLSRFWIFFQLWCSAVPALAVWPLLANGPQLRTDGNVGSGQQFDASQQTVWLERWQRMDPRTMPVEKWRRNRSRPRYVCFWTHFFSVLLADIFWYEFESAEKLSHTPYYIVILICLWAHSIFMWYQFFFSFFGKYFIWRALFTENYFRREIGDYLISVVRKYII